MTQAIHSTPSAVRQGFNQSMQRQNQRNLTITLLAAAALASFASVLTVPLPISLPMSSLFISGALACSYVITHPANRSESSSVIIHTHEPESASAVYVYPQPIEEHQYLSPWHSHRSSYRARPITPIVHSRTNTVDSGAYHAPVGTRTITPVVHNRTSTVDSSAYHAPVGTRTITPVVSPSTNSLPIGSDFFSAARAPVGHR